MQSVEMKPNLVEWTENEIYQDTETVEQRYKESTQDAEQDVSSLSSCISEVTQITYQGREHGESITGEGSISEKSIEILEDSEELKASFTQLEVTCENEDFEEKYEETKSLNVADDEDEFFVNDDQESMM